MRSLRPHRAGETLAGRYRLISPLGEGGFGAAFRAWDNTQGLPVVLKMPLARHLDRPVVLERFSREIARLRDCRHPHIVPIIDDGRDDNGRPFIVMRFLPGGSLADRKKPVNLVTLHRWLPGIAAALDYIHSQGVLHRDVKPSNIFFDTQANAFLGDFGVARLLDAQEEDDLGPALSAQSPSNVFQDGEESLTLTGQLMGTLPYMAPELFEDRPHLTPKVDQYSLAVAVYELLSTTWPVKESDRDAFCRFHRSGQQSTPLSSRIQRVPVSLANAVAKALAKSPDDRFRDCREFAAAVLAEVQFTPIDRSHRRFLCPGCKRLVRVPDDFGGRSCRCPSCNVTLRVSQDLDALWRPDEDPRTTGLTPRIADASHSKEGADSDCPDSKSFTAGVFEQVNACEATQTTGTNDDRAQSDSSKKAWTGHQLDTFAGALIITAIAVYRIIQVLSN
jgi:serine/threonine protein kinase